jgi:hypothetical protein
MERKEGKDIGRYHLINDSLEQPLIRLHLEHTPRRFDSNGSLHA